VSRPTDIQRATVRWVGGLFAATVLLQRFAVPGLPVVALVLPVLLLGGLWGVATGLARFDPYRLTAWLLASGAMATAIGAQHLLVMDATISPLSWSLFVTTWAPFTLRLVDRCRETYIAVLRVVVAVTMCLAGVSTLMLLSQLAGMPYRDLMASVFPSKLLLHDFVITYPLSYGSHIYRSNAWIGLEPSIVSAQLGIGLVAALLVRARPATLVILLAGMVSSASGSGFAILVVAVIVMLVLPGRHVLRPYAVSASVALVLMVVTPLGRGLLGRVTEVFSAGSSANLRAVMPYQYLWHTWVDHVGFVLLGGGPGSSQVLATNSAIEGLLIPTPIKIFFDYGLLAGGVLAAFIVLCYMGGPSRSLAVSLFVSLWGLQPGTTVAVLVAPLLLLVSWWSPRDSPVMELTAAASPGPAAEGRVQREREVPV
jgi:hypothetical protein